MKLCDLTRKIKHVNVARKEVSKELIVSSDDEEE